MANVDKPPRGIGVGVAQPFNPGSTQVHISTGIPVIGDLDKLELRDADGTTGARGERDIDFAEPVKP